MVAQNNGEDGGGKLEDLGGVHGALKVISGALLSREVEKVFAEVVSLLEEGLLPQVVLDILEVTV